MIEYSDNSYMLVSVACLAGFLEGQGKIEIHDDMQLTYDCIDIINQFDKRINEITNSSSKEMYPDWETTVIDELMSRYGKVDNR